MFVLRCAQRARACVRVPIIHVFFCKRGTRVRLRYVCLPVVCATIRKLRAAFLSLSGTMRPNFYTGLNYLCTNRTNRPGRGLTHERCTARECVVGENAPGAMSSPNLLGHLILSFRRVLTLTLK